MKRTRIKICGITTLADAQSAIEAGADALGFVFVPQSKRYVSPEQAAEMIKALPSFVTTVGLLMNPTEELLNQVVETSCCDVYQFHGNESVETIEHHWSVEPYRYMKAIASKGLTKQAIEAEIAAFKHCRSILIDGHTVGALGGSGERADWSALRPLFSSELRDKLILAGGLRPDNVTEALTELHPYAIDLSSGVEISPGIKSADKMRSLCDKVHRFDSRTTNY